MSMRIAVPRMSILVLLGLTLLFLVGGGWALYARVFRGEPLQGADGDLLGLVAGLVLLLILVFLSVRELWRYPLTYTGGTYRLRRRTIPPGSWLLIGPITGVEGRHLCFDCSIYVNGFSSFGLRLRGHETRANLEVVNAGDSHIIRGEMVPVYGADWGAESRGNGNQIEADIPMGTQACYVVVQSHDPAKAIRVYGQVTMCARLCEFFHLPTADHFPQCHVEQGPPPTEGN